MLLVLAVVSLLVAVYALGLWWLSKADPRIWISR